MSYDALSTNAVSLAHCGAMRDGWRQFLTEYRRSRECQDSAARLNNQKCVGFPDALKERAKIENVQL